MFGLGRKQRVRGRRLSPTRCSANLSERGQCYDVSSQVTTITILYASSTANGSLAQPQPHHSPAHRQTSKIRRLPPRHATDDRSPHRSFAACAKVTLKSPRDSAILATRLRTLGLLEGRHRHRRRLLSPKRKRIVVVMMCAFQTHTRWNTRQIQNAARVVMMLPKPRQVLLMPILRPRLRAPAPAPAHCALSSSHPPSRRTSYTPTQTHRAPSHRPRTKSSRRGRMTRPP